MPRYKKGPRRPSGQRSGAGGTGRFTEPRRTSGGGKDFSMIDEARNTLGRTQTWDKPDSKLRFSKIAFISAGHLELSADKDQDFSQSKHDGYDIESSNTHSINSLARSYRRPESHQAQGRCFDDSEHTGLRDEEYLDSLHSQVVPMSTPDPSLELTEATPIDSGVGMPKPVSSASQSVATSIKDQRELHNPSSDLDENGDAYSDSASEVIVFRGRVARKTTAKADQSTYRPVSEVDTHPEIDLASDVKIRIVDDMIQDATNQLNSLLEEERSTENGTLDLSDGKATTDQGGSIVHAATERFPDSYAPSRTSMAAHDDSLSADAMCPSMSGTAHKNGQNSSVPPYILDHASDVAMSSQQALPDFVSFHNGNEGGRRRRKRKQARAARAYRYDEDELVLDDYVDNMDGKARDSNDESINHGVISSFASRQLDMDLVGVKQVSFCDIDAGAYASGTESLLNDLDVSLPFDQSDADVGAGELGSVETILSKREGDAGIQYLVVWGNCTTRDACWVPLQSLIGNGGFEHVEAFEAREAMMPQDSDELSSSDVDGNTPYGWEDTNDDSLQISRGANIARKLQEYPGLAIDGLCLEPEDAEDILMVQNSTATSQHVNSVHGKRGAKGAPEIDTQRRSASQLADAYDGFDVMNFERPSLRKRSKGRRSIPSFDLDDSDLETSLRTAWENDRTKKKERKQSREELRSQGLLGLKNGTPDLSKKYKEGITFRAASKEVQAFLRSDQSTLSFPPMSKPERKMIHELANACSLRSKSLGKGNSRFPVLCRTSRTRAHLSDEALEVIESRLSQRFFPFSKGRGTTRRSPHTGVHASKASGATGGYRAASYMNGEVVGASAPELGADNKGRAMLEKMGWSAGIGLGALNNKGILQPVTHVIKTNKAGLG